MSICSEHLEQVYKLSSTLLIEKSDIVYKENSVLFYRGLTEAEVTSGTVGWQLSNTKHNIIHTAYVTDSECSETPEQVLKLSVLL